MPKLSIASIVRQVLLEGGPGMIYGSEDEATCSNCGRPKSEATDDMCECGAGMWEYTARGLSNMGRIRRVMEKGRG